ncbi:acetylornithine aminotransferase [Campylobacterota bacterium]|nr:acetylornithine aminotransferase [Campylobacterota bacterium]
MTLFEQDSEYLLHTYARRNLAFVSGRGATLREAGGEEYIDFTAGIGVASVGHGNARLAQTLTAQASSVMHTSNLYLIAPQVALAKKLVELSGLDARVFFGNSGAEANEGAIKIARKYGETSGRYEIITLDNSFHGRTIATLKATGQAKFHDHFAPFPDGFCYAENLADIYRKITPKTVAVMIELVQGEGGVQAQDKTEVQQLAAELKSRDILLIVDEIQTGVFRTGEFVASTIYGIQPDVITLAKGLAGGVPIGAVITTKKEVFSYGDHGSTFGGNFLSTAAAITTLEILHEQYASGALAQTVQHFSRRCAEFAAQHSGLFTGETGLGLMRALKAKNDDIKTQVISQAHNERVLVLNSGRSRVRMLPPLTITVAEIDEGFARLGKACSGIDAI